MMLIFLNILCGLIFRLIMQNCNRRGSIYRRIIMGGPGGGGLGVHEFIFYMCVAV